MKQFSHHPHQFCLPRKVKDTLGSCSQSRARNADALLGICAGAPAAASVLLQPCLAALLLRILWGAHLKSRNAHQNFCLLWAGKWKGKAGEAFEKGKDPSSQGTGILCCSKARILPLDLLLALPQHSPESSSCPIFDLGCRLSLQTWAQLFGYSRLEVDLQVQRKMLINQWCLSSRETETKPESGTVWL